MRVLLIHSHPSPRSFCAALASEIRAALAERGDEVDDCDLYAEGFDPVLLEAQLSAYLDPSANRRGVERYVDRLLAADGLAFAFPVWHDGAPAILKGFFDRTFLRGVVFDVDAAGVFHPRLGNVSRLAAVALYGADRERTRRVGDLPRRFFKHNVLPLTSAGTRLAYHALYGMDGAQPQARTDFLESVRRAFLKW